MNCIVFKEKITKDIVPVNIEIVDYKNTYQVFINGRFLPHSYSREYSIEEIISEVGSKYIRQSDL